MNASNEKTQPPMLTPEMQQLVERAEKGDQTALEPLRRLLDEMPLLWQHYGDLSEWAQRSWLDLAAGSVEGGSKRRRRGSVGAVENGGAQTCISAK
jgi:hypothetical protein